MKVIIAEDELFAVDKLKRLIHRYNPQIDIVDDFDSVEAIVKWFKKNEAPDLLFLDIHLADGSCFEIFDQVAISCPIIFTTAYDHYAIDAFKLNSVDYLLKPVKFEDLRKAIDKFKEIYFYNKGGNLDIESLARIINQNQKEYKSRFLVKAGNQIKLIPIEEIAYFQFEDRVTLLTTKSNHRYSVNYTMDELEVILNPNEFSRANRQFIIHITAINKIHPWFKGRLKLELTPKSNLELVVSADRSKEFKTWLAS